MRERANRSIKIKGKMSFPFTMITLLQTIQHVNQLTQPAIITAIESESDARPLDIIIIRKFFGCWVDALDFLADDDVGKIFIHGLDGGIGMSMIQPNNKELF